MRIGFNLMPYSPGGHGGAEVYISNLIRVLGAVDKENEFYLFGPKETVKEYAPQKSNFYVVELPSLFGRSRIMRVLGEQLFLPLLCKRFNLNYLVSNYVVPVLASCKHVVVVHDALFRRYPELFEPLKLTYWKYMLPLSVNKSRFVITVSRFSANEICTFFPKAHGKLYVTTEGVRPNLISNGSKELDNLQGLYLTTPYILCVATFGKHKNIKTLVSAFGLVASEFPGLSLILVGGARTPDARDYKKEVMQEVNTLNLKERIIFIGHISDYQLANLYKNAEIFVLPSLYEGFGLPIIEAQSFGCPVICSNAASMPEVAGKAALTFDPKSAESIAENIRTVLIDDDLRSRLSHASLENVKRFSWERAAADLIALIERDY